MSDSWLPVEHGADKRSLQPQVARGLKWTVLDSVGRQVLSLIVFVVLASLLEPVDFGLVALAAVFVGFAQIFVDQGLGDALVQRRVLTRSHIDTAFWVAVATGVGLSLAGVVLAIPISTLFGEPALQPILQALSLVFVLSALSSVQVALLRRELQFRALALRAVFAIGGGGAVGIALAYMGFGAWALVGQQLATAGLSVAALWRVSPWRPGRQFSRAHFRELFSYGINIVGSDVLTFLSRNTDNLLIGAFLGTPTLGIYAVGFRILEATGSVLVGIARKVAFPAFSRLQADRARMRRAFFRVSRTSGVIVLPGYVGLALVAPEMTTVLFGERWAESGLVAATLFLIGPVLALQSFSASLLYAVGRPDVVFRFRLAVAITNVAGFMIAVFLFREILAVAAAYVIRGYLLLPLNLYLMRTHAGIRVMDYLRQMTGIAAATLAMTAAVLAVKLAVAGQVTDGVLLAAEVLAGGATFGLALLIVERRLVREVLEVATQAVPGAGRRRRRRARGTEPEMETAADVDPEPDVSDDPDDDLASEVQPGAERLDEIGPSSRTFGRDDV